MKTNYITFREFVQEIQKKEDIDLTIDDKIETAKYGINVPRIVMPQLSDECLAFFKEKGITVTDSEVDSNKLLFGQANFHKNKVKAIIKDIDKLKDSFIYVSEDGYILDGNHRALAFQVLDKRIKIKKIGEKFLNLVNMLQGEKFVKFEEKVLTK